MAATSSTTNGTSALTDVAPAGGAPDADDLGAVHPRWQVPAERLRMMEQRLVDAVRHKRRGRDPNATFDASLTLGQRIADGVAATMGSWRFIIVQSVILAVWVALNVSELFWRAWDPYPFILLNLMLSFQAAYAAPIIMMSQNRQSAKDRLQAELDLQTDLKAETLIEELHGSMEDLRLRQWQELLEIQQRQIELLHQTVEHLSGQAPGRNVVQG